MRFRPILIVFLLVASTAALGWYTTKKLYERVAPQPVSSTQNQNNANAAVPQLSEETILTGLTKVWDVGFTPEGTLIFTEKAGEISKVSNGKKQVIHTVPNVFTTGEAGLMGFVVDPEFNTNRFVYACYATDSDIRVSRWRLNEAETSLTDQKDIVMGMPVNKSTFPGRHSGCRPQFGADKNLWIGTGDVAIGTNPQNPKSLGGKILRVDREGKGVAGNQSSPFDDRIYSYGHRNVQGLAMYQTVQNGRYGFSAEHGTGVDDELNPLQASNFGYDPVPGYNESVPMTDLKKYPGAISASWSSGPTIAPSGIVILTGAKWGAYQNDIALAVLKDRHIRILELDDNQKVVKETELYKGDFGRIRSVVTGPNNDLYVSTDNGGGQDKIIKLSPR